VTGNLAGRVVTVMRRVRLGLVFSVVVPPEDACDLIRAMRNVGLALIWAATVVVTIAVMVPVGVPARVLVSALVIELIGFVVGAVSLGRKQRKNSGTN
jgi:hypothetical protein